MVLRLKLKLVLDLNLSMLEGHLLSRPKIEMMINDAAKERERDIEKSREKSGD